MLLVGLGLIVFLGLYLYQQNSSMNLQTSENIAVSENIQAEIQQFIQTQAVLRAINIGTDLFSDRNFRELQAAIGPPPEQATGRVNPFTPVP